MTKVRLNTTRRPNYLRAGIKFKDGVPLGKEGQAIEVIEVDAKQLKILQGDDNVAVQIIGEEAQKPSKQLNATEKFNAVKEAILGLDKELKENWTADGSPQVTAIEAVVQFTVSADLRNKVWQALNKK